MHVIMLSPEFLHHPCSPSLFFRKYLAHLLGSTGSLCLFTCVCGVWDFRIFPAARRPHFEHLPHPRTGKFLVLGTSLSLLLWYQALGMPYVASRPDTRIELTEVKVNHDHMISYTRSTRYQVHIQYS